MATAIKLKSAIKQLEAAMKSNAVSKENKSKFKTQLDKAKSDLASLSSPTPKKGVTKTKVLTTLQKLKGTIKSNKALSGYKNSGIDIEKDANVPALKRGVRVSKGLKGNQYGTAAENKGRKYYEYRLNRADVKQPPKKYPKLEDGGMMEDEGLFANSGMMAKGGLIEHGLKQGDMIMGHSDNNVVVKDKSNKIYVININNGTRLSEDEFEKFSSREKTKFSKMSDGGYMAKGGKLWVNSYDDDKREKALHRGKRISDEGNVYYENRLDHADVDRRRRLEHGGEMHRLEDSI
jgi:hypothetical protein